LIEKTPESFTERFEDNKKALGKNLSSNRLRNIIAGYISRLKRNTQKIIKEE
jgi:ribosomal protein S17E